MTHLLKRLLHRGPVEQEPSIEIPDLESAPQASVEKLEEAEAWTERKRREMDEIRREWLRYQLELEQETGRARGPRRP